MKRQKEMTNLQLKELVGTLTGHLIHQLARKGKRLNAETDNLIKDYKSLCDFYEREFVKPKHKVKERHPAAENLN